VRWMTLRAVSASNPASTRGQPGVKLGSSWGQAWVNMRSIRVQPRVNHRSTCTALPTTNGDLLRAEGRHTSTPSSCGPWSRAWRILLAVPWCAENSTDALR